MNEVNLLKQEGLYEDVERLELLSVKTVEMRRLIRVEKFVLLLGFVEDLPFSIMNSILLLFHREHIDFTMIYISTLLTCLGFGMKLMSSRIIYVLNSDLKYFREYGRLQRNHSVSKVARRLTMRSEQLSMSLRNGQKSGDDYVQSSKKDEIANSSNQLKSIDLAISSMA